MDKKGKAIVIVVLAVAVILGLFIYTTFYGTNYKKAIASEASDICATPPSYTDEQWREHMSHHPDRYAQCLNK